eukprot:TRINITY_DN12694_c0_g1_i1.p1 TRINITY_DN12694_c0_g1~~TRINITY_DN12694_c0_g1_i1.p1  ORF type:complete len:576 (+),score=115.50 TRINITY_DN12694_c0_g1_i1:80-1807(+)
MAPARSPGHAAAAPLQGWPCRRRRRGGAALALLAAAGSAPPGMAQPTPAPTLIPYPPQGQCQTCPSGANIVCCEPSDHLNGSTPQVCATYPQHLCCDSCGEGLSSCACDRRPCTRRDDTGLDPALMHPTGADADPVWTHCCGRCGLFPGCGAVVWNTTHCVYYEAAPDAARVTAAGSYLLQPLGAVPSPPSSSSSTKGLMVASILGGVAGVVFLGACLVWIQRIRSRRPIVRGDEKGAQPYEVLSELGRGGFGEVYLVKQCSTGKRYAMKCINCDTREEAHQAREEARMLDKFSWHPQMVKVHDRFFIAAPRDWMYTFRAGTSFRSATSMKTKSIRSRTEEDSAETVEDPEWKGQTRYYIVMDLWEDGDLQGLLSGLGPQAPGKALLGHARMTSIIAQICQMLHHLHNHQPPIAHRDLKPQNVLVADHGQRIALTDFGLARQQVQTYIQTQVGSMPYIAPECWRGHYDVKVDMWSLGVLIWAMATLRVGRDQVRCLFAEVRDRGFHADLAKEVQAAGYSKSISSLMCDLLQEDPRRRPSAGEVLARLGMQPIDRDGAAGAAAAAAGPDEARRLLD